MTKGKDSHSKIARAHQSEGIDVIFDQNSPASSRSPSKSSCGSGRSSDRYRGRGRSPSPSSSSSKSSSSSSGLSSRPRSRSHPRCHRRSSRCRCDNHHRCDRSPPRRYRAHSRSYSRSPLPDKYSRHRSRSRSRSSSRLNRSRRDASRLSCKVSRSRSRIHRSRSKSRPSGRSVISSLDDKRELRTDAKANAVKILVVEKLELAESVKPILSDQSMESKWVSAEPETWVRQDPEKTPSESSDVDSDDTCSPTMSPKRKIISFSINTSVVKPTAAASSCAKVTSRVDSYERRKPYGHWVPVKSGRTSNARKRTLAVSH